MSAPWHFIVLVEASQRGIANLGGEALGYGPLSFSVPLTSALNPETVTHYACCTPGSESFKAFCEQAKFGRIPSGVLWNDYQVSEAEVITALSNAKYDVEDAGLRSPQAHFLAVINAEGLARSLEPALL